MDEAAARRTLGVGPSAGHEEVRAAFRRLIRFRHPDVAGPGAGSATIDLIAAYRRLRSVDPAPRPPSVSVSPPTRVEVRVRLGIVVEGSTILVGLPRQQVWGALLEAADRLGEVTYVDASAGLIEAVVEFIDWPVCSVVLTALRRPHRSEVTCTVEALSGDPAPPEDAVARLVADHVRAVLKG
ncbi:MAG: hypothetical protein ACRD0U_03180 [Acidimicrobiales bacterium]